MKRTDITTGQQVAKKLPNFHTGGRHPRAIVVTTDRVKHKSASSVGVAVQDHNGEWFPTVWHLGNIISGTDADTIERDAAEWRAEQRRRQANADEARHQAKLNAMHLELRVGDILGDKVATVRVDATIHNRVSIDAKVLAKLLDRANS